MDAKVVPVDVSRSGALDVPNDPRTLGWWTGSQPLTSSHGSTVIVGHVDSAARGRGALFDLEKASPGDLVKVSGARRTFSYRVIARRVYVKADLPESVFAADGPPYLVLITCGGPFDQRSHHYRDNVVVYALPST
jgi:LPXTG-site transpeptidase (sortase) family protein